MAKRGQRSMPRGGRGGGSGGGPPAPRQDKMGFPVPLQEWLTTPGPVRDYVHDVFSSQAARSRELIDNRRVLQGLESEVRFGRKACGLLSLELWQQAFHDQAHEFRSPITTPTQEVIQ